MSGNSAIELPHIATNITSPQLVFEKKILDSQVSIEAWFREKWQQHKPLFNASVDLRNAGFKLAPIDTNIFPAGFNNLNPDFLSLGIMAASDTIFDLYPKCKKILIIPESHTRSLYYFANLAYLQSILCKAGFVTKIGSLLDLAAPKTIEINGQSITLHPIQKIGNKLICEDFEPDLIILNNDFSESIPEILDNITQPIEPSPNFSWTKRSKIEYFGFYQQIANEFCQEFALDPWLIQPLFTDCGQVDFLEKEGLDCVENQAEQLFNSIKAKYKEHKIDSKPFIMLKADNGTYGMAVLPITELSEIKSLNRKQRAQMGSTKGGKTVSKIIIQEGIPSLESYESNKTAEPVIYMLGKHVIGGFYRVHPKRGQAENLNAPGMQFEQLAFAECCNNPDKRQAQHTYQNIFYSYSVIARLAALATCLERDQLDA